MKIKKIQIVLISIITALVIMPFFWLKPGELNIGGDGTKMFFYDPINYLHNGIYISCPFGTGIISPLYLYLSIALLFVALNAVLHSMHLINVLYYGVTLVIGFLSIYLIMKEILFLSMKESSRLEKKIWLKVELTSIVTGLLYIFLPTIIRYDNYANVVINQDQVFLNPLIFFLVLRYLLTRKAKYMLFIILVSLICSYAFSYFAAPAIFSFYPFVFLFLIIYVRAILKKTLPIKGIIIGLFLFVAIHAFHLIPELFNIFDPGSDINMRIFSKEDYKLQVQYFYGILEFGNLPANILQPAKSGGVWLSLSFLIPLILILGFLQNKKKALTFLLTASFFLLTLFLLSAKVSYLTVKFYELLFLSIPGFGMFRNFHVQWMYVFSFFYALLFGQVLFSLYMQLGRIKGMLLMIVLFVYIVGSSWVFISGEMFRSTHIQSKQVEKQIIMDPEYEKILSFIRALPIDGKIIIFPFSDFNYQVIHGKNNGAYVGNSTIGQLTGVKDFAGYWHTAPYSDALMQAVKEKDYMVLKRILGYLNIRYIFYNSDPRVYDDTFSGRPYEYVKQILPSSQKSYQEFIKPLVKEKLFAAGPYNLYLTDEATYSPHFYVPRQVVVYENNPKYNLEYAAASSFIIDSNIQERTVFIEKKTCVNKSFLNAVCETNTSFDSLPQIYFQKINPVKYYIKVTNTKSPFMLVLSESFHRDWKVFINPESFNMRPIAKTYFNGDVREGQRENVFLNKKSLETMKLRSISEDMHFTVNGYANGWYITPQETGERQNYELIVEMTGQRIFYVSVVVSFIFFILMIVLSSQVFIRSKF